MKKPAQGALAMRASVSSSACILWIVGCTSPGVVNRAVEVPQGLRASGATATATAEPESPTSTVSAEFLSWNASSARLSQETSAQPVDATTTETASSTTPASTDQDKTSRITIKGGPFYPDSSSSDDGWLLNVGWMKFFNPYFAMEFELGYLDAPGNSGNAISADGWGLPLMVNGRGNLPLGERCDIYAGLGLGFVYADIEVSTRGGSSVDDDAFLFAGNGLAGASFDLTDSVVIGLEGKYYVSGRTSAFDWELDGLALLLTLGFNR